MLKGKGNANDVHSVQEPNFREPTNTNVRLKSRAFSRISVLNFDSQCAIIYKKERNLYE